MSSVSREPSTSLRFRLGLVLLALSYVLGWPAVGLAGSAAPWVGVETAAMLGTATYAFSWVLLGVAIVLGGKEVQEHGRSWSAGLRKRLGR